MISSIKSWLAQPFNASGSAFNWFLFFGLLIVISFAWSRIVGALEKV